MRLRPLVAAAALVLVASPARGAAPEPGAVVFGVPVWLVLVFNLLVFFGILVYFAGPAVVRLLEGKKRELRHALEEAERQRREAERMAVSLAGQVEELRREMDELLERASREGERERQQVLAEAEREGARLRQEATHEIGHRLQQARQELTRHAVLLAADLAEQRMARELTPEDRQRLFRENLDRMESL